ncbi:hypothetical protein [Bradyrhizobium sp. USDA 4486]
MPAFARATLAKHILSLAENIYRLTGMNEAELRGAEVELLMRRLSERFSIRLGLDDQRPDRSGPCDDWRKSKNPLSVGVGREAEEDWGRR